MSRPVDPMRGPKRVVIGLGVGLVLLYTALGFRAYLRNQATLAQIEELRGTVFEARTAADGCNSQLALDESIFRQRDASLDSLRSVVEGAEEPQPDGTRGVDAEEYEAYMADFNAYNAGVEEWEAQAEAIREREAECTELVLSHNLLVDSLRRVLESNGLVEDG